MEKHGLQEELLVLCVVPWGEHCRGGRLRGNTGLYNLLQSSDLCLQERHTSLHVLIHHSLGNEMKRRLAMIIELILTKQA